MNENSAVASELCRFLLNAKMESADEEERHCRGGTAAPNLGDLLTARPEGINEQECWAILCQAVQALQDLFLSDGATCMPLVTPSNVRLSSRGRVIFVDATMTNRHQNGIYLAPEYRPNKYYTDTEKEKMWIFGLGETLRRAAPRPANDLAQVLTYMTRPNPALRASLMYLLETISSYCKLNNQTRPFSHIVMDLHLEAMAAIESIWDTPWGPPAMPELLHLPPRPLTICESTPDAGRRRRWRNSSVLDKHPMVQRAASRLYREMSNRNYCTGPEFVVRSGLARKKITIDDGNDAILVIMLNGQKIDVVCDARTMTAERLFEHIVRNEGIEENFMLGLSALIGGDFVFLPADTKLHKALSSGSSTLFVRIRFFLPNLRPVKSDAMRHLVYLQLRRSILEHQLPCSFAQLVELNGLALQAEFGDYERTHHGTNYFLAEHYIPETMSCVLENDNSYTEQMIESHTNKRGLTRQKAEENFIVQCQNLTHYGGHFYTATWMLKDGHKDVWLFLSPKGINLYERAQNTSTYGPKLYEMFEWKSIQTLCYSKHYLCIIPQARGKLKKYKLKMDHKKSYFAFRLASLHHQFFLRLRTVSFSLQTLSQHFGIALKAIKNETNSLKQIDGQTAAKRRGAIKMGTRAFGRSKSRSMEQLTEEDYLERLSLHSAAADFLPDFHETLNATLAEKLDNFSFAEERVLKTVTVRRDCNNSLGLQITEGSDGNVYVQSVIMGGPAHLCGGILAGDQIIAADGKLLIGMSYQKALEILTNTGNCVDFMVSRTAPPSSEESQTPVEKYLTESCTEVPYHKHIRYEVESSESDKNGLVCEDLQPIALPRSLGLGRKWRGPVKYPVTPVKTFEQHSDEEQVFI